MPTKTSQVDFREVDFAETLCVRDIESRLFQALVLKIIDKIEGVAPAGGNIIDNIFGRDNSERVKTVFVEQDLKKHAVSIRVEINVRYGVSIPQKAEEVQTKIAEEVSKYTGLHVSRVHVIFKDLIIENKKVAAEEESGIGL